jgi:ketosteroid isomerase-like protein
MNALRLAPAALAAALCFASPLPARAAEPQASPRPPAGEAARREALAAAVRAREQAFAKTMADRDHAAFAGFVSEEAVFLGRGVLRGREAVAEGWKPLFEGKTAPFSWQPETVEVLDSGRLALSRGPVLDPDGRRTGTFTSTWRLEPDGEWRVVLDSGCPPCACQ